MSRMAFWNSQAAAQNPGLLGEDDVSQHPVAVMGTDIFERIKQAGLREIRKWQRKHHEDTTRLQQQLASATISAQQGASMMHCAQCARRGAETGDLPKEAAHDLGDTETLDGMPSSGPSLFVKHPLGADHECDRLEGPVFASPPRAAAAECRHRRGQPVEVRQQSYMRYDECAENTDLRALAREEFVQRKAVYQACGSSLCCTVAAALHKNAAAQVQAADGVVAASGGAAGAGQRAMGVFPEVVEDFTSS
eukprot:TRINITY_DN13565_c0_g1_i1.p1 TRINITY_DN13565_c0_g1~~TRINITY_DN13565_c0_g1_i1.p1  ORF type:complete len:278 (+),score=87.26 TRINITY_DN13565_c0_g1_i1:86-835(+)